MLNYIRYLSIIMALIAIANSPIMAQNTSARIKYLLMPNAKGPFKDGLGREAVLYIFDQESIYISDIVKDGEYFESLDGSKFKTMSELRESGANSTFIKHITGDSIGQVVYYNRATHKMTIREQVFDKYFISDEPKKIDFKWQLTEETKDIGKFKCFKAITRFRGRNYIAWYSPEIPIGLGPLKFSGLPGLILEIADEDKEFIVKFESIDMPYQLDFKILPPTKGKKITFKAYKTIRFVEAERLDREAEASNTNRKEQVTYKRHVYSLEKSYDDN